MDPACHNNHVMNVKYYNPRNFIITLYLRALTVDDQAVAIYISTEVRPLAYVTMNLVKTQYFPGLSTVTHILTRYLRDMRNKFGFDVNITRFSSRKESQSLVE